MSQTVRSGGGRRAGGGLSHGQSTIADGNARGSPRLGWGWGYRMYSDVVRSSQVEMDGAVVSWSAVTETVV